MSPYLALLKPLIRPLLEKTTETIIRGHANRSQKSTKAAVVPAVATAVLVANPPGTDYDLWMQLASAAITLALFYLPAKKY
jgi:hypothetical protein